jgi:hypothetical protein
MTIKTRFRRKVALISGMAALTAAASAYGVQAAVAAEQAAPPAARTSAGTSPERSSAKDVDSAGKEVDSAGRDVDSADDRGVDRWKECMTAKGAPEYAKVVDWIGSGRDPLGARRAWISLTGTPEFISAQAACEKELPPSESDGGVG